MQRDMEGEIRAIMKEYMPLPAGDDAVEAGRGGGRGSSFYSGGGGGGGSRMNGKTPAPSAGQEEGYFSAGGLPHEGYQAPQVSRTRSNTIAMQLTPLGGISPL
jgi:hypothetical protein